jgi:hypothetical protein
VRDVTKPQSIILQKPPDGILRERHRMLGTTPQALLGNGAHEISVDQKARRRIRVEGVQTEDDGHISSS